MADEKEMIPAAEEVKEPEAVEITEEAQPEAAEITEEAQPEAAEITEEAQPKAAEITEEAQPEAAEATEEAQPEAAEATEEAQPEAAEAAEEAQPEAAEATEEAQPEAAEITEEAQPEAIEATEEAQAEAAEITEEAQPEAAEATEEAQPEAPAETAEEKAPAKTKSTAGDKVMTVIGIVLCVILAPLLIANLTMIIRSYTNADEVPSFGGYCPFIVMTDSMKGTIDAGDLVIDRVVTDPSEIERNDVISFFDPASRTQSIVTHRVVEITKDKDGIAFITKGDANNTRDDDPVPGKNVVGVYWFRIPGLGHVVMFMQSTTGLVVCVALPILLLIGYDALRRRRYDKQQKADTEALLKELEELREKQQN